MNRQAHRVGMRHTVGAFLAAFAGVLSGCGSDESATPQREIPMPMMTGATPFIRPGLVQPPTESAEEAELESTEEVIGVSVGGVHRAYACSGMSSFSSKVINDVIDGVPVTVTFCDRTRCARAFTASAKGRPLDVQLGGWTGEKLMVLIDGRMLAQDSDEIPLQEMPIEKSTWSEWKEAHPDTDVFTDREHTRKPPAHRAE